MQTILWHKVRGSMFTRRKSHETQGVLHTPPVPETVGPTVQ